MLLQHRVNCVCRLVVCLAVGGLLLIAGVNDARAEAGVVHLTGADLSAWRGDTARWLVVGNTSSTTAEPNKLSITTGDGVIVNGAEGRTVNIVSKEEFRDVRAHIEFMLPKGSNSGVYFMGRYELQIYDSYGVAKDKYPGIECGGIYERWDESRSPKGFEGHSPRVNVSRSGGQWQSFDVVFRAPRFDARGKKLSNARFEKVLHNGVVIHEDLEVLGPTRAGMTGDERPRGPILLQGDHGPIAFRNIRISPAGPLPFFAMDTGTRDAKHQSAIDQLAMVKRIGYDGIGWTAGGSLVKMLAAAEETDLRPYAVYLGIDIEKGSANLDDNLKNTITQLAGRNAILWLYVRSNKLSPSTPEGDEKAVAVLRQIAELAEKNEVRIALYPHADFWIEQVEDAVRVVKKVERANVGVTFNLCHWLKTSKKHDLDASLRTAMPHLFVVTISGADNGGDNWKTLIQTLDCGTYDMGAFIDTLTRHGYNGPIGLQAYGIGGDANDNLTRSMDAWKRLGRRQ